MAEQQGQEKTEQPTERKRQKARDEGQATFSKELSSAALLGAATLTLYFASDLFLDEVRGLMHGSFTELRPGQDFTITLLYRILGDAFSTVAPVLLLLSVVIVSVALLSSVIQVGFRFTLKPLVPKFSKISPLTGIKRLFSTQGLAELVKSLAKLTIIGLIGYFTFVDLLREANGLAVLPQEAIIIFNFKAGAEITGKIVLALFGLSVFDYFYQRWQQEQQIKMTKQEVREETKETEGDPQLKARIRQIQREMSNARMMQEVPKADALVVNPTHFSVALLYDRDVMEAPQVIAKGADFLALRMRTIANENAVPIVEKPALARELYASVEIGEPIPERLFKVIAEILAQIYRLRPQR